MAHNDEYVLFYCIDNHLCMETTSVNSRLQGNCSIIQYDYPYLLNPINKCTQVNYGICHGDMLLYRYTFIMV